MPAPVPIPQTGDNLSFATNAVLERTQSQWIFTPADLHKTPSIIEGLPVPQELANRQKGVNFITKVGIMLKLPQMTLSTACVFFHRYYMRFPMQVPNGKGTHHYQIAATALFLATKVDEHCRKMKELIVACCRVAQKNPNAVVDEQSKEYWKWRDTILHHEDMLLEALCFDLQLELPYQILFEFLCYYAIQDRKGLRNTSWAFLNDSYLTTMCLMFSPKTIAGSALYAGLKLSNVSLPDDEHGRPWWDHLGLNIMEVANACSLMVEVYENPTQTGQASKDAYLKGDDIMSFERTRRTQSPSVENSPAYSMASQGTKRERESSWGHEGKNGQSMDRQVSQQSNADHPNRSPKRLRTGSAMGDPNDEPRGRRVPPLASAGNRIPPAAQEPVDDIQQRIDDIANSSQDTQGVQKQPSTSRDRLHIPTNGDAVLHSRPRHDRSPGQPGIDDQHARNGISDSSRRDTRRDTLTEEVDYGSEEGEV